MARVTTLPERMCEAAKVLAEANERWGVSPELQWSPGALNRIAAEFAAEDQAEAKRATELAVFEHAVRNAVLQHSKLSGSINSVALTVNAEAIVGELLRKFHVQQREEGRPRG